MTEQGQTYSTRIEIGSSQIDQNNKISQKGKNSRRPRQFQSGFQLAMREEEGYGCIMDYRGCMSCRWEPKDRPRRRATDAEPHGIFGANSSEEILRIVTVN